MGQTHRARHVCSCTHSITRLQWHGLRQALVPQDTLGSMMRYPAPYWPLPLPGPSSMSPDACCPMHLTVGASCHQLARHATRPACMPTHSHSHSSQPAGLRPQSAPTTACHETRFMSVQLALALLRQQQSVLLPSKSLQPTQPVTAPWSLSAPSAAPGAPAPPCPEAAPSSAPRA